MEGLPKKTAKEHRTHGGAASPRKVHAMFYMGQGKGKMMAGAFVAAMTPGPRDPSIAILADSRLKEQWKNLKTTES
jgi:hypothetical protein